MKKLNVMIMVQIVFLSNDQSDNTPSRLAVDEDCTPLPNHFPLPKYYRADVEEALTSRKMTRETTSAFYSAVASGMLVYKKYPTREDYITVGRAIIEKYDFLSQPVGTPYVSGFLYLNCTIRIPMYKGTSPTYLEHLPKTMDY